MPNLLNNNTFKRFFCGLAVGFLLLGSVVGHSYAEQPVQSSQAQTQKVSPALWKIDSGNSAVYLFGSVHMMRENVDWFSPTIAAALSQTDALVMETVMNPAAEGQIRQFIAAQGLYPSGQTLQESISPELFQQTVKVAQTFGLPGAAINALRPWYVSMLLSVQSMQKLGLSPENGVDVTLMRLAKRDGKTLLGLETPLEQMNAMSQYTPEIQEAMLGDTLEQLSDINNVVVRMEKAWASGDEARIEEAILVPMKEQPEMYQALLVERNKSWLADIEEYVRDEQRVFVVVGAAHLVGGDSVISYLRAKGYKVDRVQ